MANRQFHRSQALEREVKQLFVEWTQASGDPVVDKALGVASVTKTGTGDFRITLQDKYNRLMGISAMIKSSTAEDITFQLKAEAVATDKTIDVYTLAGATETDPADDTSVIITLWVKNTSVVN